jgi:hypothetical protein
VGDADHEPADAVSVFPTFMVPLTVGFGARLNLAVTAAVGALVRERVEKFSLEPVTEKVIRLLWSDV